MQIALTNAQGQDIPIDIQDNRDGTFTVEYSTASPGDHRVTVLYAGAEIPQSPIVVPVQSHVDVTKVKVDGLEPSEYQKITVLVLRKSVVWLLGQCCAGKVIGSPVLTVNGTVNP